MNITRRKMIELMSGTALAVLLPVGSVGLSNWTPIYRFIYRVEITEATTQMEWVPIDAPDDRSSAEIEHPGARFAV